MSTKGNKILFLTRLESDSNHISSKVLSQIDAMRNLGFEVDLVHFRKDNWLYLNEIRTVFVINRYVLILFYFYFILFKYNPAHYVKIYIRHPFVFSQFAFFLFLIVCHFKRVKVVYEFPTYPFLREVNTFFGRILYFYELFWFKIYSRLLSIVTYSGNVVEKIRGIKAIKLVNIVSTGVGIKNNQDNNNLKGPDSKFTIIAVSSCNDYHGLDRIILGLISYPFGNIRIFIVGDGPFLDEYRNLVSRNNLDGYVKFFGQVYGEELEALYGVADIGVAPLAMHRINLFSGSPIKSYEYAVRGLPFVCGYLDYGFLNSPFVYRVIPDETAIDLVDLVKWYINLSVNKKDIISIAECITWEEQLNKVFSF